MLNAGTFQCPALSLVVSITKAVSSPMKLLPLLFLLCSFIPVIAQQDYTEQYYPQIALATRHENTGRGATLDWLRAKGIKMSKLRKLLPWKTTKQELVNLRMKYLQTVNRNLRAEIRQMMSSDQLYRKLSKEHGERHKHLQLDIDNQNIVRLRQIISEVGGWPTEDHATKTDDVRFFGEILTAAYHSCFFLANRLKQESCWAQ